MIKAPWPLIVAYYHWNIKVECFQALWGNGEIEEPVVYEVVKVELEAVNVNLTS